MGNEILRTGFESTICQGNQPGQMVDLECFILQILFICC